MILSQIPGGISFKKKNRYIFYQLMVDSCECVGECVLVEGGWCVGEEVPGGGG